MKRALLILWGLCAACTTSPIGTPTAVVTLRPLPSATAVPPLRDTPAIIATPIPPTPLPTPVTYVVVKGDTLIRIAWTYGVTVEALQAANPTVDERFLSVGTVLVIPGPAGEATPAPPTATPEPIALTLNAPTCYDTPTGVRYCFVEARNADVAAVGNVSAQIVLADANGLPLASALATSAVQIIPPGGAAPLMAAFANPPSGAAAVGARLLSAQRVSDPARAGYIPLTILSHTSAATETGWRVIGQAQNNSGVTLSVIWVTVTLYDAEGNIVGYRTETLAGGAPDFTVTVASLTGAAERYTVVAEGRP